VNERDRKVSKQPWRHAIDAEETKRETYHRLDRLVHVVLQPHTVARVLQNLPDVDCAVRPSESGVEVGLACIVV